MHHWAMAEELLKSAHTQEYADKATADACLAIAHALLALLEIFDRLAKSQETA
jgi:hypothetical protein